MTIKIDSTGAVIVTTPPRVSKTAIAHFVESARDWIEENKQKQLSRPKLLTHEFVYYFGKKYSLRLSKKQDGSVRVGKEIIAIAPFGLSVSLTRMDQVGKTSPANTTREALRLLETWLFARAREYIAKRTHALSALMGLPFNGLAFKVQKTRWGSCSSTKHLNFNLKLIHAPKEVIDYVIIHELAHTRHMNHGRQFWDLVATFDPDHSHHRRWLARYGSTED